MISRLYRLLSYLLRPAFIVLPYIRARKNKEIYARIKERFGQSDIKRPQGQLIWIHAASNGETLSALPLIDYFAKLPIPPQILFTTMTVTAAKLVQNRTDPSYVTHQFIPYDHLPWIEQFHRHWAPDMVIWVESELWPNHLRTIKQKSIAAVLVNARLSDNSVKKWKNAMRWIQDILSAFDVILAQTTRDQHNFETLGIPNIQSLGNLKDLSTALPYDEFAEADLQNCIGTSRPTLLFASTHAPEESIIGDIHLRLKQDFPNLLSIIIPRHPSRGETVATSLVQKNLSVARRSLKMSPRAKTDIYIADTLGETGLFYHLCPIAFIGNSLGTKPGGGHNLMEPAWFDCAILSGDDLHNFSTQAADMSALNAVKIVKNNDELYGTLKALLEDQSDRDTLAKNAYNYVTTKQAAGLDTILNAVKPACQRAGIL